MSRPVGGRRRPPADRWDLRRGYIIAAINDPVGLYLADAGSVPVPAAQQQTDLAKRIQAARAATEMLSRSDHPPRRRALLRRIGRDGELARRRMIVGNLRLVVSWATRYQHPGSDLADLIQDGNIGLLRAVDRFDPARGYRFATYASWWIRQALGTSTSGGSSAIPLPAHVQSDIRKLRRAERHLAQRTGIEPDDRSLADHLGWDPTAVWQLRRAARPASSLDDTVSDDGTVRIGDLICDPAELNPEDRALQGMLPAAVADVIVRLPAEHRQVLSLRFGLGGHEPCTLDEVARQVGLSRERVRQITTEAITTLAPTFEAHQLIVRPTDPLAGYTRRPHGASPLALRPTGGRARRLTARAERTTVPGT